MLKLQQRISFIVILFVIYCFSTGFWSIFIGNNENEIRKWYKPFRFDEIGKSVNNSNNSRLDNRRVMSTGTRKSAAGQNCTLRAVKLSPTPLPVTGLASFPGSGNTWTRHLIQQMTGFGTSNVYCDRSLREHGFPFECHWERQKTVVVKTHDPNYYQQFKKLVFIIRNPYDALLSFANFATAGHTGHPPDKVLKEAVARMFEGSLRDYVELTRNTIVNFKGPVFILQYEKLKTDMANELQRLALFLDVNVTQTDIDCTVKLQEGNFHRKTDDMKHLLLLREVYDRNKLQRMRVAARYTERILKNAYNVDIDVGGDLEHILLDTKTDECCA